MRKKVVTIGGGSGSFSLLSGLKKYVARKDDDDSIDIKFIACATDSGGSSGRLRDQYGYLPPGDIRRGLVALSDASEFLRKMFEIRFDKEKGDLNGHNFGNLFMTAAIKCCGGNEKEALEEVHKILNVRGRVIPVTGDDAHICVLYTDGIVKEREDVIDVYNNPNLARIANIYLKDNQKINANPEALEALLDADAIIIGPGDLYTSLICNSLAEGTKEAIKDSKALKIYNCNIMTKPSETPNYSVADHLNDLEKYLGKGIVDIVTYNNKTDLDASLLENYKKERKHLVEFNEPEFKGRNIKIHGRDLVIEQRVLDNLIKKSLENNFPLPPIRHDSEKTAKLMMDLIFPL